MHSNSITQVLAGSALEDGLSPPVRMIDHYGCLKQQRLAVVYGCCGRREHQSTQASQEQQGSVDEDAINHHPQRNLSGLADNCFVRAVC